MGVWQQAAVAPHLAHAHTGLFAPHEQQPAAASLFVPTAGVDSSMDLSAGLLGTGWLPALQQPVLDALPAGQQAPAPGGGGKAPRLRWTAALHASFVAAVKQLGGAQQVRAGSARVGGTAVGGQAPLRGPPPACSTRATPLDLLHPACRPPPSASWTSWACRGSPSST